VLYAIFGQKYLGFVDQVGDNGDKTDPRPCPRLDLALAQHQLVQNGTSQVEPGRDLPS
jgi:hypothetical protein